MIELEKYHGHKSRFTCPACGTKGSFVRYQTASGEYLSFDVGKCNRESKCGFHRTPRQFFADNPNPAFSTNQKDLGQGFIRKNGSERLQTAQQTFSTINEKYLTNSLKGSNLDRNNFIHFLLTLFTADVVQSLIDRFKIGTASGNRTIFWQIDQQSRIRTGRIMAYDKWTGRRLKTAPQSWVHSALIKKGLLKDFELKQSLFGLHQLGVEADKDKTIGLVESDKTAIICSALIPDILWMSAGAKGYLNAEMIRPLANRKVILFPDSDAHAEWTAKAKQLRSFVPNLKISKLIEGNLTDTEKREGFDIADFLIEQRRTNVLNREAYNRKVDQIKTDAGLMDWLDELFSERVAIMTENGLPEAEAVSIFFQAENIEPFILNNF
ncbi:MAG: hypothetical protein K1X72_10390 [Pyrinomonadaceae bacterium]|nr:hypothetical protein [Pyrinomonadaceae bacterium]